MDNLNGDDSDPLNSQNFERANNAYDSIAADDFTLSAVCKVTAVYVVGHYYNNPGTYGGASENVTFYQDHNGHPGRVIAADKVIARDHGTGSFRIHLPVLRLRPGTYWLSVQLNLNSTAYGQWGWDNSTQQQGSPALWKNPGDGFGTGCSSWSSAQACLNAPGSDMVFAILGKGSTQAEP